MTILRRGTVQITVAAALAALAISVGTLGAQRLAFAQGNAIPPANNPLRQAIDQGPIDLPPTPPQGAWGEVIMANSKWMVVQNHQGQQFPIANDSVAQFLIRWPILLNQLTPASMVEAIGANSGNNGVITDHVDVYEGEDRALVQPKFAMLLPNHQSLTTIDPGYNRFMNGYDTGPQNLLFGWAYPYDPAIAFPGGNPGRIHVVGNAVTVAPTLTVSIMARNVASILPDDTTGMSVTQMTRGDTSFAEKGDLAYLMPTELSPRTVRLSQVVLYKKIPRARFQKAAR